MAQPELARTLTLAQLVFMGVGTIVGAGIYAVIGAAAGLAGRAVWLSMLLAGAAAALTALSYAELISARHRSGAEYQFLRAAFPAHPILSYLCGLFVALNCAATAATVALAFAGYLRGFVDVPDVAAAVALLTVCTILNVLGIRQAAWASVVLVLVEVGGLLLLILPGFIRGAPADALEWAGPEQARGVFAASALLFFAYIGFEDMTNLSEEARRPATDVPKALLLSVAITSVLYVALVWAALSLLTPADLARSEAPLATVAARVGPWTAMMIGLAAMFATASTAMLTLVSISRLVFAMAREGDLPAMLARTGRRNTPWAAALLLFAAACALLPLGEIPVLAGVSALGILIAFTGVHVALIILRRRAGEPAPAFRVPLSVRGIPLSAVAGIVANLSVMTQFEPIVYQVVAVAIAVGLVPYVLVLRGRPR